MLTRFPLKLIIFKLQIHKFSKGWAHSRYLNGNIFFKFFILFFLFFNSILIFVFFTPSNIFQSLLVHRTDCLVEMYVHPTSERSVVSCTQLVWEVIFKLLKCRWIYNFKEIANTITKGVGVCGCK